MAADHRRRGIERRVAPRREPTTPGHPLSGLIIDALSFAVLRQAAERRSVTPGNEPTRGVKMQIDVYCHLIPPKLKEIWFERQKTIRELRTNVCLYDLDARFRVMDRYPDLIQVLTPPGATPDELAGPGGGVDMARRINDEMAELVEKYPYRFAGAAAVLPIADIDASLKEIDRAINELKLRGILLRIPINGKPADRPEFFPIYEKMCEFNLPIWLHPHKNPAVPDYPDETESKYLIWHMWGLMVESTNTMTRLVFGGVMEKYPELKFIIHHCGAMVPFSPTGSPTIICSLRCVIAPISRQACATVRSTISAGSSPTPR